MVRGLDGFTTTCRIANNGIDPQIILEAQNGGLYVLLGNWNTRQAREVARMIFKRCDEADGEFAAKQEK